MTHTMLLFSLGPVQSFIAQARKTRDLWLGSYLLALLMEASMEHIEPAALIFPAIPNIEGNIADLPNKYIALFPNKEEAQAAAERSEKQLKERWLHICQDVWNMVLAEHGTIVTRQIWDRQTNAENFFEIFWVIVEGNEQDYPAWLKRTQEALAARKRLRTVRWQEAVSFEAWDEPGEKSTISGERVILRTEDDSREAVHTFWKGIAENFAHDLNQSGEERLDAIDTVKRFAFLSSVLRVRNTMSASFPSTSSIATASFVKRLLTITIDMVIIKGWLDGTQRPLNEMEQNTIPYLERLAGDDPGKQTMLQRDGDCYFLETFTPHRLKKDYGIEPVQEAERRTSIGRKALNRLLKAADTLAIPRPTPYYAMIQIDGDKMGRLLGGVKDRHEHSAISKALSIFSRKRAAEIVHERYPGRLIYAGGDDAFALAPLTHDYTMDEQIALEQAGQRALKTVFALIEQLQLEYCKEVKKVVRGEERRRAVSTSAGIAIAHHYTSLSYARRMTNAAEELAKKEYGRNALVVIVLRRSGEQTRVGCHWEYTVERNGEQIAIRPLALFEEFYELFKHDVLSPACVYTLLEEAPSLVMLEQAAQQSEIIRILQRQRHAGKDLSLHKISALAQQLSELAKAMDSDERHLRKNTTLSVELQAEEARYGLVEVFGWLLVMIFLARKELD